MRLPVPTGARAPLVGAGVFLAVAAVLYAAIMVTTGGVFSFTLDDPYIHLAMAEEIGRGGYGVNPGEPASASSSALYPYLLAALLKLGLGQSAALAVNLAAGAASTALLAALAGEGGLLRRETPVVVVAALAATLVLALNLAGLAFTGMEHGLHVALALAALYGLARLERGTATPSWLVVVLALAPLVRFEGAAGLAAGAVALMFAGRGRAAAAAVALSAAGLALFAWSLHARGLPWLPSSVLAKAGDGAHGPGAQLVENLRAPGALFIAAALVLPWALEAADGWRGRPRPAMLYASLALAAQLAVGTFGVRYGGWLHRYEAWAVALAGGALLLAGGARVRAAFARAPAVATAVGLGAVAALLNVYVLTTLQAPLNARSIRLQQREMHRFAAEVLRAPVAVNDLGWVGFRNDHPVLDLWGLASERARRARQAHLAPGWMDVLAHEEGVRAVMVYDAWIGPAPTRWVRLGELRARVPLTVRTPVAFYAVDPAAAPAVRAALAEWARGLPAQDAFVFAQAPLVTKNSPAPRAMTQH